MTLFAAFINVPGTSMQSPPCVHRPPPRLRAIVVDRDCAAAEVLITSLRTLDPNLDVAPVDIVGAEWWFLDTAEPPHLTFVDLSLPRTATLGFLRKMAEHGGRKRTRLVGLTHEPHLAVNAPRELDLDLILLRPVARQDLLALLTIVHAAVFWAERVVEGAPRAGSGCADAVGADLPVLR